MQLSKHARFLYQPVLPLGKNRRLVTNSKAHREVARQVATEGTVLLKNDGTLPLQAGAKICLFGIGAGEYLLHGGGSGTVFTENEITLTDGLRDAAKQGEIGFFEPLVSFYTNEIERIKNEARQNCTTAEQFNIWRRSNPMVLPVLPEELYRQACDFGDTALFCVARYSSEGDTNGDRFGGKGDFYLWDEEQELLDRLCRDFQKVIVVLNTCGPVSTLEYKENPKVGAVLYPLYGGIMAGASLVDILMGRSFPSGHLQDTLARDIEDYPSTKGFHDYGGDPQYANNIYGGYQYAPILDPVYYTEDIFVGYRWFETFAPEKVVYPFGFGLGYTTFQMETVSAAKEKFTVSITVRVKNTGSFDGKQVVQAYLSAPQGKLGKAKKVLCAFAKTRTLKPGEQTDVKLHFDIREFASFDDLGKIAYCAFLLEKGEYTVHVGDNVRDTKQCLAFVLDADVICRKCKPYMAPKRLKERLCADGTMEPLPEVESPKQRILRFSPKAEPLSRRTTLAEALKNGQLEAFLASFNDDDLGQMLYGHAMMNASNTSGIGLPPRHVTEDSRAIPLIPTADGPAGLRIRRERGVQPFFIPCENTISQTWNLPLAQKAAVCVAREAKENNIGIWLAPALNIHRNPMCGRNFEYYSEDPLSSGLFASATVKGVQSEKIATTVKHYCANNRENNRRLADSCVSMRALREIYLRCFEIVVKRAKPWALMTSYNPVNGVHMSKNWDAINGILRSEWKYDGVVMTDWRTLSNLEDEVHAGSDVKMPVPLTAYYSEVHKTADPTEMIRSGQLDKGAAYASAYRILKLMDKLD